MLYGDAKHARNLFILGILAVVVHTTWIGVSGGWRGDQVIVYFLLEAAWVSVTWVLLGLAAGRRGKRKRSESRSKSADPPDDAAAGQ